MFKRIPWGPTILFIVAFPLLLGLGVWQLQRLQEKIHYLEWRRIQSQAVALTNDMLSRPFNPQEYEFRRMRLEGQVLPESFTVLSRNHPSVRGVSGKYVLSPFLIKGTHTVVLLNWGWEPNGKRIPPLYHLKTIDVMIRLPEKIYRFTPANHPPSYYTIVPKDFLERRFPPFYTLHTDFYVQWVVDDKDPKTLLRPLPAEPPLPNRHLEYALTWFSFAFTFAIIYGIYLRQHIKSRKKN